MDTSALKHSPSSVLPTVGQLALIFLVVILTACSSSTPKSEIIVSVKDQKLGLYDAGVLRKEFVISTSKFGIGDQPNSYRTPLGKHEIIAKIGHGLPTGAVLKSRHWNGEVLKPNAPGRDPIVSRILWLRGMEGTNRNAMNRYIYIHGTTEENRLGKPASYGCIRMGMKDVVDLFNDVGIGAKVVITRSDLPAGKRLEQPKPTPEAETVIASKKGETLAVPSAKPVTPVNTAQVKDLKKDAAAPKSISTSKPEKSAPVAKGKSKKSAPKNEKITTGNRRITPADRIHS
jgi:hypothetical protein